MKTIISFAVALTALVAVANDSMWFTSGNQLVPMQATDISVAKEILTITLPENCDDKNISHRVLVDVYYEFYNAGAAQVVTVGFEADHPYMEEEPAQDHRHPNIYDFTVEMNGQNYVYHNKLSKYSESYDSGGAHTYVYYFTANFKPGKNIIKHSYKYASSGGVGHNYWVNYKLTPAARWSGNTIADFTLRVKAQSVRHFFLDTPPFVTGKCTITGTGKSRVLKKKEDGKTSFIKEVFLRNGVAEWHIADFNPKSELFLSSADAMQWTELYDGKEQLLGRKYLSPELIFFDDYYFKDEKDPELIKRIVRNLPYAGQGHVFKTPALKKYFESLWWYIPETKK